MCLCVVNKCTKLSIVVNIQRMQLQNGRHTYVDFSNKFVLEQRRVFNNEQNHCNSNTKILNCRLSLRESDEWAPRLLVEKQTEYGRRRPKRKMYFCRCSANVLFNSGPFQQSQTMINLNNSIMKLLTGGFCRKTRYFSFVTFAYMRNVWRSHRYIQTKNKRHIYLLVVAFVLLQLRAATVLMQFCVTLNCFVCCFAFLLYQSPRPHELLCTHVMSIVKMWFMNSKQKHTATVFAIFSLFSKMIKDL